MKKETEEEKEICSGCGGELAEDEIFEFEGEYTARVVLTILLSYAPIVRKDI